MQLLFVIVTKYGLISILQQLTINLMGNFVIFISRRQRTKNTNKKTWMKRKRAVSKKKDVGEREGVKERKIAAKCSFVCVRVCSNNDH